MHILLVEDDDRVAAALRPALHRHGISTTRLARGRARSTTSPASTSCCSTSACPTSTAWTSAGRSGQVSEVPVIVVSARGEVDDRILGLHSGADDYLVKPYDIGELVARVHAVYRRRRPLARAAGTERGTSSCWTR